MDLNIGDTVVFGRPNGKKDTGTITKVNPKSYGIETEDGKKWRCSKALCDPSPLTQYAIDFEDTIESASNDVGGLDTELLAGCADIAVTKIAAAYERGVRDGKKENQQTLIRAADSLVLLKEENTKLQKEKEELRSLCGFAEGSCDSIADEIRSLKAEKETAHTILKEANCDILTGGTMKDEIKKLKEECRKQFDEVGRCLALAGGFRDEIKKLKEELEDGAKCEWCGKRRELSESVKEDFCADCDTPHNCEACWKKKFAEGLLLEDGKERFRVYAVDGGDEHHFTTRKQAERYIDEINQEGFSGVKMTAQAQLSYQTIDYDWYKGMEMSVDLDDTGVSEDKKKELVREFLDCQPDGWDCM